MTASPFPSPRGDATRADRLPLPPPRAPLHAQTWREIAHLLSNLPVDVLGFVYIAVSIYASVLLSVTVVGLPLLALSLLGCRQLGKAERARARALLGVRVEEPSPLRAWRHGFFPWLWARLKDSVAWRHALYFFIRLPWGWFTMALTLVSLFVGW
ncbi:sensor domain-containing protein, partial [Streptomyces daliensis]|nr:sensor domain-containing protein [Streptomyces daliensis]